MTQLLILLVIGAIYLIFKLFEGIFGSMSEYQSKRKEQQKRNNRYGTRKIDNTKTLFDRNFDIIQKFADGIDTNSYGHKYYYIENLTRDCINEICLAENKRYLKPGYDYLSTWKNKVQNRDWLLLAGQVENYFQQTKKELVEIDRKVGNIASKLEKLQSEKLSPERFRKISKKKVKDKELFIEDLKSVLEPNEIPWSQTEQKLIDKKLLPKEFPLFESSFFTRKVQKLNESIAEYNKSIKEDFSVHDQNSVFFKKIYEGFLKKERSYVLKRIDFILNSMSFPTSFPKSWHSDYDKEQSILIVEILLPDVVHSKIFKKVELKTKVVEKPLTKKEFKENAPQIHPALMLRVAYEIFRNDVNDTIKLLVLNGIVEYDDPKNGKKTKAYTSSLLVNRDKILDLELNKLDPLSAFLHLKGMSAGPLIDIIPIVPTISLDKNDRRFIETKEVLNNLSGETNLASMDWKDFENLIAQLFEKEFSEKGVEVKVTQSSRDRGVDVVIFDPDPIKGGKFVVQAKRYTRTVDVSAVRDLCAVVKKEGASRGILVTTSNYGSDAYSFAQNEPVTLLNGSELLGLLDKHGYKFRINIAEARKILKANEKSN